MVNTDTVMFHNMVSSRSLSSKPLGPVPLSEFVFEVDSFRKTVGGSSYANEHHVHNHMTMNMVGDDGEGVGDVDHEDDEFLIYGMTLGGIDDREIYGVSGSMMSTFRMSVSDCIEITFEYTIDCLGLEGTTAYADVLMSIDDVLYGVDIYDYIHSCSGQRISHENNQEEKMLRTKATTSFSSSSWWKDEKAPYARMGTDNYGHGWSLHTWTSPTQLSMGEHTIRIGSYLSQKQKKTEHVDLHIKNVRIRNSGGCTKRRTYPCRSAPSNQGGGGGGGGIMVVTPNIPSSDTLEDTTKSIQDAIDEANRIATTDFDDEYETCTVQVSIPRGEFIIAGTLTLNDRVHLKGSGVDETILIKIIPENTTEIMGIQLGHQGSTPQGHMHLSDITMHMEYDMENSSSGNDWSFPGGHCIRSGNGIHDFEIRSVKLEGCGMYGIGLQIKNRDKIVSDYLYQRLSIQNIKMNWIGSDGIDMKGLYASENDPDLQNNDIDMENLFIMNVGLTDDAWACAIDLAGANVHIKRFMAIQTVMDVPGSITGLNFRNKGRRVSNTLVEDIFVFGFNRGISISEDSNRALFTGGTISDCNIGVWIANGATMVDGRNMCLMDNLKQIEGENIDSNNAWHYLTERCASWDFVPAAFL